MLGDLTERLEELSRSIPIITVCGSGYRSSIAASVLQKGGFEMVSSMDGGMTAWKRQALPTVM